MKDYTEVKDHGQRQDFGTGSVRDTREGKGRFDLIPGYPHQRLARHYENGSRKYGDWNWSKGQPLSRYLDSAERHLLALKAGQEDEDHAAALLWNIYSFVDTERRISNGSLPSELNDLGDMRL